MSLTPDIERVLAEHRPVPCAVHNANYNLWWFQCEGCDWQSVASTERLLARHEDAHRAHVADHLAALLGQHVEAAKREAAERAWAEGYTTAVFNQTGLINSVPPGMNPYEGGSK